MGHEYIEVNNSHAAIEAYRRAVGSSFPSFLLHLALLRRSYSLCGGECLTLLGCDGLVRNI
jgi:hypothetical protein